MLWGMALGTPWAVTLRTDDEPVGRVAASGVVDHIQRAAGAGEDPGAEDVVLEQLVGAGGQVVIGAVVGVAVGVDDAHAELRAVLRAAQAVHRGADAVDIEAGVVGGIDIHDGRVDAVVRGSLEARAEVGEGDGELQARPADIHRAGGGVDLVVDAGAGGGPVLVAGHRERRGGDHIVADRVRRDQVVEEGGVGHARALDHRRHPQGGAPRRREVRRVDDIGVARFGRVVDAQRVARQRPGGGHGVLRERRARKAAGGHRQSQSVGQLHRGMLLVCDACLVGRPASGSGSPPRTPRAVRRPADNPSAPVSRDVPSRPSGEGRTPRARSVRRRGPRANPGEV